MKDDTVYLQHILDAIEKINSYAAVGKETFMTTTHWQDARPLKNVQFWPSTRKAIISTTGIH